jgi:hypothetical protein
LAGAGVVVVGVEGWVVVVVVVVDVVDGSRGASRVGSPPVVCGVVAVGGDAPSVVVGPVVPSAPRAPPASGPLRLAAVRPPPASTESTMRHDGRRARMSRKPLAGGLSMGLSSCGPLFIADRWSAPLTHDRGHATGIHIGRQAGSRKGFVKRAQRRSDSGP